MTKPRGRTRALVFVVVILFLIFFAPVRTSACTCYPPLPPLESLEASNAVFSGRVVRIENQLISIFRGGDYVIAVFDVSKVWKGPAYRTLKVLTTRHSAACGFPFRVGEEYIVYAYGGENSLETQTCTRTKWLGWADEDVRQLGEGVIPQQENPSIILPNSPLSITSIQLLFGTSLPVVIIAILLLRRSLGKRKHHNQGE